MIFLASIILTVTFTACSKKKSEIEPLPFRMEVFKNDIPFPTEKYLRIGYSIRTWEYAKDGLALQEIVILDNTSKVELMRIEKADLPKIHKNPIPANPYFENDIISSYYLSIQLPIPLNQVVPSSVGHRFIFLDTIHNQGVEVEGAVFSPRIDAHPIAISSPVKGTNWIFMNQSTNAYHYNTMFFIDGKIGTGEKYAFDNLQFNDSGEFYIGDPVKNDSYFNYLDTLYAVANGIIEVLQDGLPENDGNAQNITFNTAIELAGNHIIMNIGGGYYAFYAHCHPGSFLVQVGDSVKEGDPVALLGNSGNSTAPHLHFQICNSKEFFMTNGIPFVLKKYTKLGEYGEPPITPVVISNSMMEEMTMIFFD